MKQLCAIALSAACLLPSSGTAQDAAQPDHAALRERVLDVLENQFDGFRDHAGKLAASSVAYCADQGDLAEVKAEFRATWLAWAPLDAYQFGPMETLGAALTVNFFPDKKGFVGRALTQLRKLPVEDQANPDVIARYSAAAQGLPALERLIHDSDAPCPLLTGISAHLSTTATALYDGWFADQGWAELVRAAGPDNPVYLSNEEFTRQIITALGFSILRMRDHRLGRPLGSYERAFPKRAEAWRSGLTNEIIAAQLSGLDQIVTQGFGDALSPDTRVWVEGVIGDIQHRLDKIDAPLKDAVEDLSLRVRIEGVQAKMTYLQLQLDEKVAPELAVQSGFSAGDGD
ncbi:imelysin family protein [Aliiroseovarius crassostreae]|uniref:imelysin family protein n=1 Tax=Aliiroseovarius crassostreae TaxID=154981 RepID=UPI003C7D5FEC